MERPSTRELNTSADFLQWYWLKEELVAICKQLNIPHTGSKFELRDRIVYALDHDGAVRPTPPKNRPKSSFNWAKEKLSLETLITDSISFGPNFRRFMKSQLGNRFRCHSDFMDWVKANPGKTLSDAVIAWEALEGRKNNESFKRAIAAHNMLSQYVRDFLEDNPGKDLKDALTYWNLKKKMPTEGGAVKYHSSDLKL